MLLPIHRWWSSRSLRIFLLAVAVETAVTSPAWSQSAETALPPPANEPPALEDPPAQPVDPPFLSLLSDDVISEKVWVFISREKEAPLTETWQLQQLEGEAVLVCRGEPYGYLKTTKAFADFQLKLEWRFPFDENGNSGILLYTNGQEKDQVWPTAIQVQLHQPVCGSVFCSGGAQSDNEIRDVHDVCKAVNEWNSCEITSMGGRLSVEMNGKQVGVVTGCRPNSGGIALQSEGSEVHFRRIRVTELKDGDNRLPSARSGSAHLRHSRRVRAGSVLSLSLPEPRGGFVGVADCIPGRPCVDRMNAHVVDRDRLVRDDHPVRTRRRERLVVDAHPEDACAPRYAAVRFGHPRELRR
jgi:hypothetical protein